MASVMAQALEPILSSELVVGKSMFIIVFDIKTLEMVYHNHKLCFKFLYIINIAKVCKR